MRGNGIANE